MRDELRIGATAIVWGGMVLVMMITAIFASVSLVWVAIVMGIAAAVSTNVIWNSGKPASQVAINAEDEAGKAKRGGRERITRLIEDMSDEELQDFGAALQDYDSRRR
jgi:hypothetical protein